MHVSGKVSKFLRWLMNVNVIFFSNLISVPPRLFSALSRVWQTWKLTIRKTFLLFYFCNVIGAIWNAWMRMSFIPNGARLAVSDVLYLVAQWSQRIYEVISNSIFLRFNPNENWEVVYNDHSCLKIIINSRKKKPFF